jgi:ABC-type glycerol-3-phosphate transport system substrate-binding protein
MRRAVFLILVALLLLPVTMLLANAGSPEAAQVLTIKKWGHAPLPASNDTEIFKLVSQKLKAKLGYDVKFEIMGSEAGVTLLEKENLLLASGDLPDILDIWWNERMMAEGTVRMEVADLQKWMPLTYQSLTGVMKDLGLDETLTWNRFKRNGKLVQIPNCSYEASIPVGIAWRKDLLDKWGLPIPKTLQEWETAFKRFKQEFPDLYPYGGMGGEMTFASFSAIIGGGPYAPWHWYLREGKLVNGAVQPELKETYKVLADWWKKGYIDPESTIMNNDNHWNLFNTGSVHDKTLSGRIGRRYAHQAHPQRGNCTGALPGRRSRHEAQQDGLVPVPWRVLWIRSTPGERSRQAAQGHAGDDVSAPGQRHLLYPPVRNPGKDL